jgi:replicative DNA helicase
MSDEVSLAEDSLIGAVLLTDGKILDDLELTGLDFQSPQAGFVYDTALGLRREGKSIDLVTLLSATKQDVTGRGLDPAWLHQCAALTPSPSSAPFYAEIVQDHALRRRLRVAGAEIVDLSGTGEVEGLVDAARASVERAGNVRLAAVPSFGETVDDTLDALEKPPLYVPSVWPSLNKLIDGLSPGRVYVIGARPGVGKTVAALQLALGLCAHGNVAFSSLEMTAQELQIRAFAYDMRMSIGKLMRRQLDESDWQRIASRRAKWAETPMFIDDASSRTVMQIKQHARNVARKGKLAAVVVDYLQLVSAPRGERMKRYDIVSEVSRELKIMAKELQVPVIALSQLNRESGKRADNRPTIDDLRESGAIEQDADVVILLHRDMTAQEKAHELSMFVAKNRHGPMGVANFHFYGQFSEIREKGWTQNPGAIQGNPHLDKTTD